MQKAIELSKLEAFELVRKRSIEQKAQRADPQLKNQTPLKMDARVKPLDEEMAPVSVQVKDEFTSLIYAWGNNDRS